jgi:hypothetical protein
MLGIAFIASGILAVVWTLSTSGMPPGSAVRVLPPFGSFEFVVVHVLAALPLSLWMADKVISRLQIRRLAIVSSCVVLGLVALALLIACSSALATLAGGLSMTERSLLRVGLAVGLLLPWCLAGRSCGAKSVEFPELVTPGARVSGFVWALALAIIAITAPNLYLAERIPELSRRAESLANTARYWEAWQSVNLLCEVGSNRSVLNQPPAETADRLADQIRQIMADISRPLSLDASAEARLQRARNLASLNQLEAAEEILGQLPHRDPAACLLLAAIQQQRQQWDASTQSCREALRLLGAIGQESSTDQTNALKIQTYDGLLTNCCHQRDFGAAESILAEAVRIVPQASAYFHFRLGQFYQLAERPSAAVVHFKKSRDASPAYDARVREALQTIGQGTSGCLFQPTAGPIRHGFPNH